MSQRISLVTNIVVAMACIAIALVAFNSLTQNTALTDALLTKLEAIGVGTEVKASPSVWAEATIPVLVDNKPAVGYYVSISGEMFNPGTRETLYDHTGQDGTVAFGPIRPGKYSARVKDPNGLRYTTTVVLYPGEQELDPVIMPALKPQPIAVSFALDLPEVVKDHAAYVRLDFDRHSPETDVDDRSWRWPSETLLVQPNGTIVRFDTAPASGQRPRAGILNTVRIDSEALEFGSAIELDASLLHRLNEITVLLPVDPRTYQPSVDMFVEIKQPVLKRTNSGSFRRFVPEYFDNLPPFRAVQGKDNVWMIEIPDWLVEAVQQRVDAATASRSDTLRPETGN